MVPDLLKLLLNRCPYVEQLGIDEQLAVEQLGVDEQLVIEEQLAVEQDEFILTLFLAPTSTFWGFI